MRPPYRYLLMLWLLTVVLGPAFVALYQWRSQAVGVMVVLFVFGLFFSLPALLIGVPVLHLTHRRPWPVAGKKAVLAVAASITIAITFELIKGSTAWKMTVFNVLAVVVATLWLKYPERPEHHAWDPGAPR